MKKIFTILIFLVILNNSFGQVIQEWTARFFNPFNLYHEASVVRTDNFGNVYVFGTLSCYNKPSFVTFKYDSLGNILWRRDYSANEYDHEEHGECMELDKDGNIYVAGNSKRPSGTNIFDLCIIKYKPNGDSVWVRRYNSESGTYNYLSDLSIDNNKNVYITGGSWGTNYDILTLKYDSNGVLLWSRVYNGSGNDADHPASLAIDDNNNVYVAGRSYGLGTGSDFCTIKYNSDGVQQWVNRYTNESNLDDVILGMTLDRVGNIIVTGSLSDSLFYSKYCTIKYNSNGNQLWLKTYSGNYNNAHANSVQSDSINNVFVSGGSKISLTQYGITTIKYSPNGDSVWVRNFIEENSSPYLTAMVLDENENVYITGSINSDYLTLRYNSNGDFQWFKTYDYGFGDGSKSICIDRNNNVYVTGGSQPINSMYSMDFLTIKYSQTNPTIIINLKILIEGIYFNLLDKMLRRDTVQVYLRDVTVPYAIRDSAKTEIDSNSFTGLLTFSNAPSGYYYLVAKHFSSVETWSKPGGESLSSGYSTYSYDFTTSNSQAYGNNLKLKGSKYCLYSGDVNQDGYITLFDVIPIYNDATNFLSGRYLVTDLTGDKIVDLADLTLCYNNSVNFISKITP